MTVWATLRRVGTGAVAFVSLLLAASDPSRVSAADEPTKISKSAIARQNVTQLRATAEAAEKTGDWDTAFTAYCHLFVLDRGSPDVREKLNVALRRAQQLRRHRDPQFQQFVATTSISDALNLFGEVINKVSVLYVERERSTPQLLWESGIEELTRALANPVFRQFVLESSRSDESIEKFELFRASLPLWAKQSVADARTARTVLRKLITTAQEAVSIRVPCALVFEVICGACNGLDEYTIFLSPSPVKPEEAPAIPDLSAQGVYLACTDGELMISGIASGSWAKLNTQLRKGDRIIRLNGRSMEMTTPASAAEAIRAAVDGVHLLEIAGPELDAPPLIERLPVTVPTVFGTRVVNPKDGIGYTRIGNFTASTPRELDEAINVLKNRDGVRALILDLRGNLGGSFLASVETAKRLIPNGLIVTTQGQLSEVSNQPFSSDSGMSAHDIPVVVLIDAETASGAEVLAAALKDNGRATLVGMPTFGKGAIQYPLKLAALDAVDDQGKPRTNRSGTVRLTIAKLIAPRSGPINGVGITPHSFEADPERQFQLAQEKALGLLHTSPGPMVIP